MLSPLKVRGMGGERVHPAQTRGILGNQALVSAWIHSIRHLPPGSSSTGTFS